MHISCSSCHPAYWVFPTLTAFSWVAHLWGIPWASIDYAAEWSLYNDRGKPCLPFPSKSRLPHSSWLNIEWVSEFPCSRPMFEGSKCSSGLRSDLKPKDLGLSLTFIINSVWPWRSPFASLRLRCLLCKTGDALSPFRFLLIMLRTQLWVSTQHQHWLRAVFSLPPSASGRQATGAGSGVECTLADLPSTGCS